MSADLWGALQPPAWWVWRLSDLVLNLLWQLAVVGGVAALGLSVMKRAPARWRYAWCVAALVACVAWPAWQIGRGWDAPMEAPATASAALIQPLAAAWGWGPVDGAGDTADVIGLPGVAAWRWWVVSAWGVGAFLMALRCAAGWWWVRRSLAQTEPAMAAWAERLQQLAQRMSLRVGVQLRLGGAGHTPWTAGVWRPVIVLPAAVLTGLPVAWVEALLMHELAHVRRWDYAVNLLQSAVEALLFFHPVVWWLSARIRTEREWVADQLAAAHVPPRDLAMALQALTEVAASSNNAQAAGAAPLLGVAAHQGQVLPRIRALLRAEPGHGARGLSAWGGLSGAVGVAMLLALGAQQVPAERPDAPPLALRPWTDAQLAQLHAPHIWIQDAATGQVLVDRQGQAAVPVASLSKLMTAWVVVHAGQDLEQRLTVSADDVRSAAFSSARLLAGQTLRRRDALALMLMQSDNRAAALLARHHPGGLTGFARDSARWAQQLGLHATQLAEPSGQATANRASAQDLAQLLNVVAQHPVLAEWAGRSRTSVEVAGRPREVQHTLQAWQGPSGPMGVAKTGRSEAAGRCVAARWQVQGRWVNVVLLGHDSGEARDEDLRQLQARWSEEIRSP